MYRSLRHTRAPRVNEGRDEPGAGTVRASANIELPGAEPTCGEHEPTPWATLPPVDVPSMRAGGTLNYLRLKPDATAFAPRRRLTKPGWLRSALP